MNKVLLFAIIVSFVFTGCEKCVECKKDTTCYSCMVLFIPTLEVCDVSSIELLASEAICTLLEGEFTGPTNVVKTEELCSKSRKERNQFIDEYEGLSYTCSKK